MPLCVSLPQDRGRWRGSSATDEDANLDSQLPDKSQFIKNKIPHDVRDLTLCRGEIMLSGFYNDYGLDGSSALFGNTKHQNSCDDITEEQCADGDAR